MIRRSTYTIPYLGALSVPREKIARVLPVFSLWAHPEFDAVYFRTKDGHMLVRKLSTCPFNIHEPPFVVSESETGKLWFSVDKDMRICSNVTEIVYLIRYYPDEAMNDAIDEEVAGMTCPDFIYGPIKLPFS